MTKSPPIYKSRTKFYIQTSTSEPPNIHTLLASTIDRKREREREIKMQGRAFFIHPVLFSTLLTLLSLSPPPSMARPANFDQDFRVTWSDSHVKRVGDGVQLLLDKSSGCGFVSKNKYMFGHVSMKIKLVSGDSAGTVTAFYLNSDTENIRDELDFEFLGNRSGQPYTVQTNVYAHGKGDKEQRVNLWFDPSADFHTYSVLWNRHHVVFFVDAIPIRVYKNNERRGVAYPSSQPMSIYSTLWNADDWATRGGLEKIDWSKAPFLAYYKDFDIETCAVPPGRSSSCGILSSSWWGGPSSQQLNPVQARAYRWVRMNHMIYDYCTDRSRFPVPPPECLAGY